jgi:hypothetical protein
MSGCKLRNNEYKAAIYAEVKAISMKAWTGPEGLQKAEIPWQSAHEGGTETFQMLQQAYGENCLTVRNVTRTTNVSNRKCTHHKLSQCKYG